VDDLALSLVTTKLKVLENTPLLVTYQHLEEESSIVEWFLLVTLIEDGSTGSEKMELLAASIIVLATAVVLGTEVTSLNISFVSATTDSRLEEGKI